MCLTVVCAQVPDNYTPPAPITAPVMGFPMEAPQPHEHAQVPPGAPQEPSMQVGVHQAAWFFDSLISNTCETIPSTKYVKHHVACFLGFLSSFSSCRQKGWSRKKSQPNTWSLNPHLTVWCSAAS